MRYAEALWKSGLRRCRGPHWRAGLSGALLRKLAWPWRLSRLLRAARLRQLCALSIGCAGLR